MNNPALHRQSTKPMPYDDHTHRDEEPAHDSVKLVMALGRFDTVVERLGDGFDRMAGALREGHTSCRDIQTIKTEVRVLQEKVGINSADIVEVNKRWTDTGERVAKVEKLVTTIETTIKLVGAFIGFCFIAGAILVSVTQVIVRGHP